MAAIWKQFRGVATCFNKFIHVRNSVTLCRVRCSKKIAVSLASAGVAAAVSKTEAKLEVDITTAMEMCAHSDTFCISAILLLSDYFTSALILSNLIMIYM